MCYPVWEMGSNGAQSDSVGQIHPCCSSGLKRNEFSPLFVCEVVSYCNGAANVCTSTHFDGIFLPLCQSKNHWQILKGQHGPLAHTKGVNN